MDLRLLVITNEKAEKENIVEELSKNNLDDDNDDDEEDSENNKWHEAQINQRIFIRTKMKEYTDTFTVHGLSRVLSGTRYESIFWFFMLIGGVILSLFVLHGLTKKYMERHVYVQISSKMETEKAFPSLTICEERLLFHSYFEYCGIYPFRKYLKSSSANLSYQCEYTKKNQPENITVSKKHWSNGLITVLKCSTWGNTNCLSSQYLRSLPQYNGGCFTWNYNGNLKGVYGHAEVLFTVNFKNEYQKENARIIVLPHDPKITELDFTKQVLLKSGKALHMTLESTLIKRLPAPFPSKCENAVNKVIFPGEYSRRSCIESYHYVSMYKKCGDTTDYIRQFIPREIKAKYGRDRNIKEVLQCISEFSDDSISNPYCPFPCEELELTTVNNFNKMRPTEEEYVKAWTSTNDSVYKIDFQFQRVDSQRIIEEMELYTMYQMACEVGGFIGLVLGASILSFIEIITFFALLIFDRVFLKYPFKGYRCFKLDLWN